MFLTSSRPTATPDRVQYEELPTSQRSYVSWILILINIVIFIAMWRAGNGDVTTVMEWFGAKVNERIRLGEHWRLITPIFLHANWVHLFTNCLSLYFLGSSLERVYGKPRYLLIYVIAGFAGNVASYLRTPEVSMGASGALFGILGAGIVFPLRFASLLHPEDRQKVLRRLLLVGAINLGVGFTLPKVVDNWAHIGGMIGGAIVALCIVPEYIRTVPSGFIERVATNLAAFITVGIVILALSLQARWALARPFLPPLLFSSGGKSVWWRAKIPARWRYEKGVWKSPEGATLFIRDSLKDPQLLQVLQLRLAMKQPPTITLDGKPGWVLNLNQKTQTIQEYQIPTYDRVFALRITTIPTKSTQELRKDLQLILNNVRFIRPPDP